jgi:hypothetical protein
MLFIYLKYDLNVSEDLLGLTVVCSIIFELPIFLYSEYLLKTIKEENMLIIALFSSLIRG